MRVIERSGEAQAPILTYSLRKNETMPVPLLPLLLVVGAGYLALKGGSGGSSGSTKPQTPTSEQEAALIFTNPTGYRQYNPAAVPALVNRLRSMRVKSSSPDGSVSQLVDDGKIVDVGSSAYELAKTMSNSGFNVWITPTLLNFQEDRVLVFTTKENPNPSGLYDVVLLTSGPMSWPPEPEGLNL